MSHRGMLVMLACMVATAVMLQAMFDTSDHTKSERIVRTYRGAGGPTVEERVTRETPGGVWSSEVLHACRGFVRVHYDAPPVEYLFDYDIPEHRIHPANPAATRVLDAIPAPPPPKR